MHDSVFISMTSKTATISFQLTNYLPNDDFAYFKNLAIHWLWVFLALLTRRVDITFFLIIEFLTAIVLTVSHLN